MTEFNENLKNIPHWLSDNFKSRDASASKKSSRSILDMAEKQENPALSLLHLQPAFGLLLVRHGVFCVCVFVLAFVYVLSLYIWAFFLAKSS